MNRLSKGLLPLVCILCVPLCAAQQFSGAEHALLQSDAQGVITGEWAAEFRPDTGTAHLMIHRRVGTSGSDKRYFRLALYRLEGLAQALPIQNGAGLKFRLKRDAGAFLFEGVFKGGEGAGGYTYVPDPSFASKMRDLGYDRISPENQFLMAVHDIGLSLAGELRRLKGANLSLDELISIGREGVSADFIRELRSAGVEPESEKQVAELRQHGVTEDFIGEIEAMGYGRPSAKELIDMRLMGVTVAFIKELEAMGYKRPPLSQLASMKMHGVTAGFIKELEARGYKGASIDQMLGMKLFGVTLGFIQAVESLGYRGLPIDLLTCLRIQGVTVDFINRVTDKGQKKVSLRELVRLRNPSGQSKGSCELQVFPDRIPD